MTAIAAWRRYRRRFGSRATIRQDLRAGVVLGVESVPDGLAAGLLAGVNPLFGLNAYIVGTLAGALTTGSVLMTVQATGAMAVIVADVPQVHGVDSASAIATLTVLAGVAMLGLGLAGAGSLVRFIPSAVLFGFVNAVAVNIVLSQLENLTGFASDVGSRLARAGDTLLHLPQLSWWSVLIGTLTVVLILVLERTRLGALAMVVAIVTASLFVLLLPAGSVATIGEIATVERQLPGISWPSLDMVLELIVPALSLALVGLVQGAAISGSVPNPDGRYPGASADFRGQGIANIACGMLQGLPVGGSMSATALGTAAGARTALANVVAAIVMISAVLVFGPLIGYIAMPALAGLLIVVGVRTFKPAQIALVFRTGPVQIAVFVVTFALTLFIPLQYAVIAGVGLAVVLHIARQSNRVRVTAWEFDEGDPRPREVMTPASIGPREVVVLNPYGALFFASAEAFRAQLPDARAGANQAYVIIRLRGTDELGVTFLTMLQKYAAELSAAGATLMVAGVGARVIAQLRTTRLHRVIGVENIFPADVRVGDAVHEARNEAARRQSASAAD